MAGRDETGGSGRGDRPAAPRTVVVAVGGRIRPGDVPLLCARLREVLDDPAVEGVVCDVGGLRRPDVVALEALARLQLAARRRGRRVALRNVGADLRALLAVTGLADLVPVEGEAGVDGPGGGVPG